MADVIGVFSLVEWTWRNRRQLRRIWRRLRYYRRLRADREFMASLRLSTRQVANMKACADRWRAQSVAAEAAMEQAIANYCLPRRPMSPV